ncbi:hypothetical protein IH982_03315 [Patescibacteria group bacterium]|nr:hypothetical protein [Patescibacteria group bacterium]
MEEPRFFNKSAWKGVAIAIIAVVAGQLVLAWQYYRLEEKRLPLIEQQLAEQKEEIERQSAKTTITSFLNALEEGNSKLALRFLTENAVVQEQQGVFSLKERILGYKVVKLEQVGTNEFRAQVEIENAALLPQVRLLRVLKVLDTYYIDSVEIAG